MSPYQYAANNPVLYVDVNGDSIWVNVGDENILYTAGAKYTGDNEFAQSVFKNLNLMNSNGAGSEVLGALSSSENNFTFMNQASSGGPGTLSFSGNETGGGEISAANLLDPQNSASSNLESVAHELFHGYQQEIDGYSSTRTVNREVGAYVFGRAVAVGALGGSMSFGFAGTRAGKAYDQAMFSLMTKDAFDANAYRTAINNFKKGSSANYEVRGLYNNFKIAPISKNPPLKGLYPLLRY